MTDPRPVPLARMIDKLALHASLSDDDRAALLGLPHTVKSFEAASLLIREGDAPDHCGVLVSGIAIRHKLSGEGQRQIVSIHIAGEMLDLQHLLLGVADHNVQTLTGCRVASIPRDALRALAVERPSIGIALCASVMVEASMYREWMLNIGRRDARTRIAHLLCEFAVRLEVQGLAPGQGYELPMTQEQIGDAVGLTAVHVNRTLKVLVKDGLIAQNRRGLTFPNWNRLKKAADFNGRYLHVNGPDSGLPGPRGNGG